MPIPYCKSPTSAYKYKNFVSLTREIEGTCSNVAVSDDPATASSLHITFRPEFETGRLALASVRSVAALISLKIKFIPFDQNLHKSFTYLEIFLLSFSSSRSNSSNRFIRAAKSLSGTFFDTLLKMKNVT